MSLFQSVTVELVCQRCDISRETSVRFHSAVKFDADYRVSECVPEADGLRVGETYEGNADRYCWECLRKWAIAQTYAAYESLADMAKQGRAVVTLKGKTTLASTEELIECAHKYVADVLGCGAITVTGPFFKELQIVWEGEDVIDSNAAWGKLVVATDSLIEEQLRLQEWKHGRSITEEFKVYVDNEYRIRVEDLEGRSLCPGR